MIVPTFWDKDITLYLKTEVNKKAQWERKLFSRCFFKHSVSSQFDDKNRINGEIYLARIPCKSPPAVTQGSIAVLGNVYDVIPEESSGNELIKKYDGKAFRINTFVSNTDYPTPHLKIGN